MIIQLFLVGGTLLITWYALRHGGGGRQLALRRVLGLAVAMIGVGAVLWPEATTWAANRVGVGRGADLLLYLLVLVVGFLGASLYGRIRQLEDHVTLLVRELALRDVPDGTSEEADR